MKIEWLFLLCWLTLISCKTPQDHFKRPDIDPTISNGGTGFRNGELVRDTTNFSCASPSEFFELEDYIDDIETRLHICIEYPRRCK